MKNVLSILGVITAVSLVGLLVVGLNRVSNGPDKQSGTTVSTIGPNKYGDLFSDDHASEELSPETDDTHSNTPEAETYPPVALSEWNLSVAGAEIKTVQPSSQPVSPELSGINAIGSLQAQTRQTSIASHDIITDKQQRIREIVNLTSQQYDQCYGTLSRLMRINAADVVDNANHLPLWHNKNELDAHGVRIGDNYYVFAYHFFAGDASQCDQLDRDASRLSLENVLSDSEDIMTSLRQQAETSNE